MTAHFRLVRPLTRSIVAKTCVVLVALLALPENGKAQDEAVEATKPPDALNVFFPFYNDSFGAAVGYAYGVVGYPERQSALIGSAMAGSQGSGMGFLVGRDLRLPKLDRLFIDPAVSVGYFSDVDRHVDGNASFPNQRAGSNDSDEDNFVTGDGFDNFFHARFKYLLPIGHGRDQIIPDYQLDRGLLSSGASGGESFNPLASGRTFLQLRPFYRSQEIEGDIDEDLATNGADLSLFWDNRDYPLNPSTGNGLLLEASRDFGVFDSDDSWTSLQAEYDQYFSLGATDTFRQRVLAFDVWTSYSPTWTVEDDGSISNRPPAFTGPTLGGLWRLRAYPSERFSDKAAIYYAAELRLIPEWNPFDNWPRLQEYVGVEWLQFAPFVEVGRVAPSWNLDELHSDMKWDVGLGVRARAKGIVVRIDTAYSEEGVAAQFMISQPFQF